MKKIKHILKWNDWFAFIALSLTWGTSFILIKKSLVAFDSIQVASLRILIATIAFTPIILLNIKKIEWSRWYQYMILGIVGGGIPPFLFAIAQTKLSSSLAGALNTLTPIFTILLAVLLFKSKIDNRKVIGVIVGLLGAGLIIYHTKTSFEGGLLYSSLIIIATILYAFNINMVKQLFNNHNPVLLTAVSFMFFGPFTILILGSGDLIQILQTNPDAFLSLGAVTILSLFSTVFGTILFFKLVQKSNTIFASSVSYTIPLVALFWGFLDGENFSIFHVFSLLFIMIGVYLTRGRRGK